ncbi:MAG: purine-nucleoside phosphorylase [Synergistaceae bacterium]|nr:purine-nucleoside phosphorylase [Synergistaceae bacterium]
MIDRVKATCSLLNLRLGAPCESAVILGSGLGAFADSLEERTVLPYEQIPNWPISTAPGHGGKLVFGKLNGRSILVMQGRVHYYEGYPMEEVVFPARVFGELGIRNLVVTNASGGVDKALSSGDIVVIEDHINFMGANPLRGPDTPEWNDRFPDMTTCYDPGLTARLERAAELEGIPSRRGIYFAFSGPSFETPAEVHMARMLGGTVVGMSTVPEVVVANAMGIRVCALSCVANAAAGMTSNALSGQEVLDEMAKTSAKLIRILTRFFSELN